MLTIKFAIKTAHFSLVFDSLSMHSRNENDPADKRNAKTEAQGVIKVTGKRKWKKLQSL